MKVHTYYYQGNKNRMNRNILGMRKKPECGKNL